MNRERGTAGGRWVKRLRTSAGKSRWALLALAVACGAVALVAAPPSNATIDPGTELTPVVSSVTTKPTAVKGTDGRFHFAYELVVSNVTQLSLEITRLEVRDPHADRSLDVLEGDRLLENVTPLAGLPPGAAPSDVTKLDPSGTAIVWLDVTVKRRSALPSTLKHKIGLSGSLPGGETYSFSGDIGRVATEGHAPIALSPPFRGGTWVADEGCCTNPTHHRRSLLGINGDLLGVNRFAIDWVRLDRQHRAWVGDPFRLDSYPSYRERVIAAAPGTVVNLRNGLPDNQPQGSLDPPPPTDEFAGNHVTVRVRRGLYLLYAHLAPGSLRVREGQRVRRGQTLGRLGNSGNSSTPHLHFQAMTTPDFFHQDSLPYSFKRFDLAGRITEPFTDENLALHPSGALQFAPASRPGQRRLSYPLDRYVVEFHSPR